MQVAITYTLLTGVFLAGFYFSPNVSWLQWLLVAGVGFSLYGPQMLIGLCGAEAVAKEAIEELFSEENVNKAMDSVLEKRGKIEEKWSVHLPGW